MSEVEQEKRFVRRLMCAKCSEGNMEYQYLNLPKDHGVYFQNVDQPLMNANDHANDKHILQFGRCKAPKNPENFVDNLLSDTFIGKAIDKVQGALGCDGCKCKPIVLNSWQEGDEANRLDGAPAITSESKVYCMYGGLITITEEPANTNSNDDENKKKDNKDEEPQEKDIMDTLPEAMKDKIAAKNEKIIAEYNAAYEKANENANSDAAGESVYDKMADIGNRIKTSDNLIDTMAAIGDGLITGAEALASAPGTIISKILPQDTSLTAAEVQAMMDDTENWYKENPTEFVETYRVSEQMIEQNYMHNRTQMMDSECLNDWGFIKDCSLLQNFNMAYSNAAKIGKSCAASYNLMRIIDEPEPFENLIREFEKKQTCPGYMDGGPMVIDMYGIGDMMEVKGYSMQYSYGNGALTEWNNMKAGDIGLWGTVVDGENSFFTFKADEHGCIKCMEDPELKLDEWSKQMDSKQNMFMRIIE